MFLGAIKASYAGATYYDCTIKDTYGLNNNTGKVEDTGTGWKEVFKGHKFNVSRLSGDIVGKTLLNHDAKQIVIINQGSDRYDFKTISIFDHPNNEQQWQILQVEESANGETKPYIALAQSTNHLIILIILLQDKKTLPHFYCHNKDLLFTRSCNNSWQCKSYKWLGFTISTLFNL